MSRGGFPKAVQPIIWRAVIVLVVDTLYLNIVVPHGAVEPNLTGTPLQTVDPPSRVLDSTVWSKNW
jgi:amino acid permease